MTTQSHEEGNGRGRDKAPSSGKIETPAQVLERLKSAHRKNGAPTYAERVERLEKLEEVLLAKKDEVYAAISSDFGNRSKHESYVAELFVTVQPIRYCKERLHEWMEPEAREVSWVFAPARAEIQYQPLG